MLHHKKLIVLVAAAMHNPTDIVDEIDTLLAPFGARKLSMVELKNHDMKLLTRRRRQLVNERSMVTDRMYGNVQSIALGLIELTGSITINGF